MGSLWWWCALLTIASAQRLDVWSPANNSQTAERDVTLGFTGILPEGDRAEAYRVCVALDGEPMTCNALDVMAREQLVLTSLLPGKRSLVLTMFSSDDIEVASASSSFAVGVGSGNVDIKSHTGTTTEWDRSSYFSTVYDLGYWAAQNKMPGVPASGPGSTLDAAKNAITTIEQLIREFGIELLIDAPCGDMTWMASVDLRGVEYVGIDVVQSVIDSNVKKHPSLTFMALDVADPSSVDQLRRLARGRRTLILCRHLLFHLPVADGRAVLRHLFQSSASYLLTSTYVRADDFDTSYVLANGHRTNLLRRPYCARDPSRLYLDAHADQYLGLWDLGAGEVLGDCEEL
mmetsp:Transcript_12544/g.33058  ORF Transcript_12544/g.33058 Transcript_12544/m.33058 type:complete len:346 (-) Transcript_12544:28-1065(-)